MPRPTIELPENPARGRQIGDDKGTQETGCHFGFDLHSGKSIGGVTC